MLVLSLTVVNYLVIAFMGDAMLEQRFSVQQQSVSANALKIEKELGHSETLYSRCEEFAREFEGRVFVLDPNGTVIVDTYSELTGTHFENEATAGVLSGGKGSARITYTQEIISENAEQYNSYLPYKEGRKEYWAVCYAERMISADGEKYALVVSIPIQDVVDRINSFSMRMIILSSIAGALFFAFMLLLTLKTIRPIQDMTAKIGDMAKGDFSVRAQIKGKSEIAELAASFNIMSEKLEHLDASRNKFVSDASHELKTPLASMKILVDALLSQPDASRELYEEFLGDISHEIDRLNYVINDLLTLVRMDDSGAESRFVPIQLMDLIDRVYHMLQPLAGKQGITLECETEDLTVNGDQTKLQQAFSNLIDNAIKYSPEDTVIKIKLYKKGRNAVVDITDQGIGISEADQAHIFDRFYRVDKARSRGSGGTGLGLSIVDNIVKQHGGAISVKSALGEGSTFTIELPLSQQQA